LYPPGLFEDFGYEVRRKNYSGSITFTADLFQNLEGLNDSLASYKAFAAAAGFNNPAKIVWNAIPYSFVLDWFFQFGKSLDFLSIQPFGGEYSLSNVGWSLKEAWQYEIWQKATQRYNSNPVKFLGSMLIKRYVRNPGFPMKSIFLTDGSLTPMQLALAAAMLHQRR
jgi:hypothetical protein